MFQLIPISFKIVLNSNAHAAEQKMQTFCDFKYLSIDFTLIKGIRQMKGIENVTKSSN